METDALAETTYLVWRLCQRPLLLKLYVIRKRVSLLSNGQKRKLFSNGSGAIDLGYTQAGDENASKSLYSSHQEQLGRSNNCFPGSLHCVSIKTMIIGK